MRLEQWPNPSYRHPFLPSPPPEPTFRSPHSLLGWRQRDQIVRIWLCHSVRAVERDDHGGARRVVRRAWGSMRAASGGGGSPSTSAWALAGPDGGGAGLVATTVTSGECARCSDTMRLATLLPPWVVVEVAPGAARAGVPGGNDAARLVPSASRGACGRVHGVPAVGAGAPDSQGRFASHGTAASPKAQC
jgi:hypothetical protein